MKKILITEAIGSLNKGEAAIFGGMYETLKILGETKYYLCTADPVNDAAEYGSKAELIVDNVVRSSSRWGKLIESLWFTFKHLLFIILYKIMGRRVGSLMRGKLWRAYLDADLLVMGHDNLLVSRVPPNLFAVPLIAKVLGKPVVIYAGSVGPFLDRVTPILTKWLIDSVDLVTLRENISLRNVQMLRAHNQSVYVTADPAFLMPVAPVSRIQEIMGIEGLTPEKKIIGITTTQEMANRYAAQNHKNQDEGYRAYMQMKARLIDILVEKYGVNIILLAHSLGPERRRDDRIANRDIYQWVRNKDQVRVIENLYTAQELKGLIGRCELLIGERTHSMIASASLGIPIVAISSKITASKTIGIIGDMLSQSEWILEIETLGEEALVSKVLRAWERRDETRADLLQRMPEVHARSLNTGNFIKALMAND